MKKLIPLLSAAALCTWPIPAGQDDDKVPWEPKAYFFGFLYRGPHWTPERSEAAEHRQRAHLDHLRELFEAGKVAALGPVLQDGDLRGFLILKTGTLDEARALVRTDPMSRPDTE